MHNKFSSHWMLSYIKGMEPIPKITNDWLPSGQTLYVALAFKNTDTTYLT